MVISTPEDQRTVGDELASELAVAVMRLARRLRAESPNDELTPTQLATMATLDRLGAQRVGDLAQRERVKAPSMTRTVARLHEAGYVERATDPADARLVIVGLTDRGRKILAVHRSARRAWLNSRVQELDEHDRRVLSEACQVMSRMVIG